MSKMFTIPAGTVLIKENEINSDMYKIVHGFVEIYMGYGTDKETIIGIVGAGKFIGDMGLLANRPSPYTVVSYDDATLVRINSNDIEDYIARNHHDTFELMKQMAESAFKLKYSIDLLVDEIASGKASKEDAEKYKKNCLKRQFSKYDIAKMLANIESNQVNKTI